MARVELPIVVLNDQAPYNPIQGATAVILNRSDSSQAPVYSDSGATNNTITQPLSTDEAGRLFGWVERGAYEIDITVSGKTPYAEDFDAAPAADKSITTAWIADKAITGVQVDTSIKDAAAGTPSLRTLGTAATQATAGNDARLSDQRTPLNASVTTAKIVDGNVTFAKLGPDAAGITPPGGVISYAGATAPSGWLLCDGSAVSRTTFATLFGIIGTTYGVGNGSTTFNVPDSRGRVIPGVDGSAGRLSANDARAQSGGEESHVLQPTELAQHTHAINDPGHAHGVSDPGHSHSLGWENPESNIMAFGDYWPGIIPAGATNTAGAATGIGIFSSGTNVSVQGVNNSTGGAHNNMQPYLIMNHIIKT